MPIRMNPISVTKLTTTPPSPLELTPQEIQHLTPQTINHSNSNGFIISMDVNCDSTFVACSTNQYSLHFSRIDKKTKQVQFHSTVGGNSIFSSQYIRNVKFSNLNPNLVSTVVSDNTLFLFQYDENENVWKQFGEKMEPTHATCALNRCCFSNCDRYIFCGGDRSRLQESVAVVGCYNVNTQKLAAPVVKILHTTVSGLAIDPSNEFLLIAVSGKTEIIVWLWKKSVNAQLEGNTEEEEDSSASASASSTTKSDPFKERATLRNASQKEEQMNQHCIIKLFTTMPTTVKKSAFSYGVEALAWKFFSGEEQEAEEGTSSNSSFQNSVLAFSNHEGDLYIIDGRKIQQILQETTKVFFSSSSSESESESEDEKDEKQKLLGDSSAENNENRTLHREVDISPNLHQLFEEGKMSIEESGRKRFQPYSLSISNDLQQVACGGTNKCVLVCHVATKYIFSVYGYTPRDMWSVKYFGEDNRLAVGSGYELKIYPNSLNELNWMRKKIFFLLRELGSSNDDNNNDNNDNDNNNAAISPMKRAMSIFRVVALCSSFVSVNVNIMKKENTEINVISQQEVF